MNVNLAVDTDPAEYPEQANQGLVNCYVVPGSRDSKRGPSVRFSPGLVAAIDTGDDICRGGIAIIGTGSTDDVAYYAFEGGVYKITWDGASYSKSNVGIVPGRGRLVWARNAADPYQVGVINDAGQFYIIENDAISVGPAIDNNGANRLWNSIAFVQNQIVLGSDDGRMYATNLLDMSKIDGLAFATAEADPDGLVAVAGLGRELYAFGRKTTEAWSPNGASTGFPFSRLGGSAMAYGCAAKHSIQPVGGTLYWVTNAGFVAALQGYQVKRVSNDAVDRAIASVDDPTTIEAYSYQLAGREFYGVSHANWTWETNTATGLWHERRSINDTRWNARGVLNVFGRVISGDYLSGQLWELDNNERTEGANELVAEVRTGPLDPSNAAALQVRRVDVSVITGRAAISGTTPQTNPVLLLDWTDTGREPWSNPRALSIGSIGEYNKSVFTTRLGAIRRGQRRTFRLRCSDPVTTGFDRMWVS